METRNRYRARIPRNGIDSKTIVQPRLAFQQTNSKLISLPDRLLFSLHFLDIPPMFLSNPRLKMFHRFDPWNLNVYNFTEGKGIRKGGLVIYFFVLLEDTGCENAGMKRQKRSPKFTYTVAVTRNEDKGYFRSLIVGYFLL